MIDVLELLEGVRRLSLNSTSMLRYWALYRSSHEPAVGEWIDSADIEAKGVFVVRVGMLRLTVLGARRALEPPRRNHWSLQSLFALLDEETVRQVVEDPAAVGQSAYANASRRIEVIEACRALAKTLYESADAAWLRHLRDEDIAHSKMGRDRWNERSADQLHQLVVAIARRATTLCDAFIGTPKADSAYEDYQHEAREFWGAMLPKKRK